MNKKIVTFFVLIFTISHQSICQVKLTDIRLSTHQVKLTDIKLSTHYVPASKYILPFNGFNKPKTNSTTVQNRYNMVLNFNLSTKIDTVKKSIRFWTATVNTDYLTMSNKNYMQEIFPESLVTSNISVQHYRGLQNRWAFLSLVSIGINSDLKKVDGNDIFINAGGVFIKNYTKKFSLGFGIFVNNNFGKPLPWPAIIVNWQLGNKYKININLPDRAPGLAYNISFTCVINELTDLSVFFKPSVVSYDIENAPENKRLLNNWQIPIGLENQWHTKQIDFFINGGLMALRSFDYAEKDLAKMFAKNPYHNLNANFFLGVGLKYRMQK